LATKEDFEMKVLRRFVLVAPLSFVVLTMIPRAALALLGLPGGGGDAPELDPSLVIGGLGAAGAFVAFMIARRRSK
jgi:hypothetical protein